MKILKKNLNTGYTKLLSFCLTLFGFSTCMTSCWLNTAAYGTPSARFKVKGTVISSNTKNTIKNIRAIMTGGWSSPDTTYTDNAGNFTAIAEGFPESSTFYLNFTDTNGTTNGLFETKIDTVKFTDPQFKNGSGNWDKGEAEIDLGNVELKPISQ